jgi:hypothetical protein
MNELAIFNQEDWDVWAQEEVNKLEDSMITSYYNGEIDQEDKELIVGFYNDCLSCYKRIPTLGEVMEDVWGYNSELTYRIAEIEFMTTHKDWNVDDETRHEEICGIQEELESMYSDWQYCNLETYIEDIFNEMKLSYTYCVCEDEHHYYDLEIQDCQIVINDCQTVLFPEFFPVSADTGRDLFLI